MQPRFLFIPHKDIIAEIIAYIMQLIAELEKSFFFFTFFTFIGRTPRLPISSLSIEFPDGCVKRETFTVNTILFPASSRYLYSEHCNCGRKRILRNTSETVVIRFLILFASVNSSPPPPSIVNNKRNISFCNFIVALYCLEILSTSFYRSRELRISIGISFFIHQE